METQSSIWNEYELIDSGGRERLERLGAVTVVRPEPNALWAKSAPDLKGWREPDAYFQKSDKGQGRWQFSRPELAAGWSLKYQQATFLVRPTPFRHLGIFPEQEMEWRWLVEKIKSQKSGRTVRVLNLFAYTGVMSVLAALAGASVCHVDAAAGTVNWAKENAAGSALSADAIRWIVDDVPKFLRREMRRGQRYDLILLDPPVFGRGPKGEIWRLEEQVAELCGQVAALLSQSPIGVWINGYATALYPASLMRLAEAAMPTLSWQRGELFLRESISQKTLPTGFFLHT